MFKRINWLIMWLVGVVTLGIYQIIAWYRMTKQQNVMAKRIGEKKIMNFIVVLLLGIVTCGIVPLIWSIGFCKQQKALAAAKGINLFPVSNTFVLWLLLIVPIFKHYVVCTNHNRLCEVYQD